MARAQYSVDEQSLWAVQGLMQPILLHPTAPLLQEQVLHPSPAGKEAPCAYSAPLYWQVRGVLQKPLMQICVLMAQSALPLHFVPQLRVVQVTAPLLQEQVLQPSPAGKEAPCGCFVPL